MDNTSNEKTLLQLLDMDLRPEEEQEEILLKLGDLVFQGSLVRMLERMDEETKTAFEALLDTDPGEEKVGEFLSVLPYADEMVAETIADIKNDILSVTEPNEDNA